MSEWRPCQHLGWVPIVFSGETEREAFVMHASVELYHPVKPTDRGKVGLAFCPACGMLRLAVDYPATQDHPEVHEVHYYAAKRSQRLAERVPEFVLSQDGSRMIRKPTT